MPDLSDESRGWLALAAATIGGAFAWLRGGEARRATEANRDTVGQQLDAEQITQLLARVEKLEDRAERQSGKIVHLENEKMELQRELLRSGLRITELEEQAARFRYTCQHCSRQPTPLAFEHTDSTERKEDP